MAVPPNPGPEPAIRPFVPVLNSAWRRVYELPVNAPREGGGMIEWQQQQEGDEDEWEEEDEVEYVTLEFGQNLPEAVLASAGEMQLLAPESKTPYARIGHHYFEGTHQTLIGNDILLMHEPEATPSYRPFATSSHRITFQPTHFKFTPDKRIAKLEEEQAAAGAASGTTGGRGRGRPRGRPRASARGRGRGRGGTGPIGEEATLEIEGAEESEGAGEEAEEQMPIQRKPGRPKGSKNKPKLPSNLAPELAPPAEEPEPAAAPMEDASSGAQADGEKEDGTVEALEGGGAAADSAAGAAAERDKMEED
ncbi:hypothetical protein JCM11251_006223 [Rhodosporidiobolus azoricus]